ncbi:hypothetical protein [Algoriphagus sp. AK58]|uniref:hypothetical protein n=1 Tax=Algoriphagus sp. AK58 TaxID=1406877 RepID=UPI001650343D|nr:hypothetical protein [Algoriphagus sp. AK58]MBC6365809.1 hypothetical protein [Algoriphagus sp. AK58]
MNYNTYKYIREITDRFKEKIIGAFTSPRFKNNPEFMAALQVILKNWERKVFQEYLNLRRGSSTFKDLEFIRVFSEDLIFRISVKIVGLV